MNYNFACHYALLIVLIVTLYFKNKILSTLKGFVSLKTEGVFKVNHDYIAKDVIFKEI